MADGKHSPSSPGPVPVPWRRIGVGLGAGLALLILLWLGLLLHRGGVFVDTSPMAPPGCHAIRGFLGPEDIAIDPVRNRAYVTGADRYAVFEKGGRPDGHLVLLTRLARGWEEKRIEPLPPERFFPHGLDFLPTADGGRLFVIDHGADGHTHAIRIFRPTADGGLALVASHESSALIDPDDIAAVDERRFYVTNLYGSRGALGRTLENYVFLPRANVVFFDGRRFRVVARGLLLANGILYDRRQDRLYVTEVTGRRIRVYRVNPFSGDLVEERRIPLPFGPDNLALDKAGRLWVAGHPNLLATARMMRDISKPAPSAVAVVEEPASAHPRVALVYRDPGREIPAASVAVPFGGQLLIGAVYGDHLLACPLPETGDGDNRADPQTDAQASSP